jgi:hypothetical protein
MVVIFDRGWSFMNEVHYLTAEGAERLRQELEYLKGPGREQLAQRLRAAIQMGDLSENADYIAAKEEQGFIEGRIQELTQILSARAAGALRILARTLPSRKTISNQRRTTLLVQKKLTRARRAFHMNRPSDGQCLATKKATPSRRRRPTG